MSIKKQLKEGLNEMFRIWIQELHIVRKDIGILIFFILLPLSYPLVYAFIYTNEVVREVPVALVDHSSSTLSREYVRKVDATPDVHIVTNCADMEEAKKAMEEKKVHGIIYIPRDFSKTIHRGEQVNVSVYCDMSGLLYYKAIVLANTLVSLEMNNNIKITRANKTTTEEEQLTASPITYVDVSLFNSTAGFASFLIPAVLILIIQQSLTLGVGLSAGTMRERFKFIELEEFKKKHRGIFRIVFGKGLCYFMIYALISVFVLCVVPQLFKLNQIAHSSTLFLFILPFLLSCIFFAMTVSILVRNRESSMIVFVFTSIPLLFISGISWPGASISPVWKAVSFLFPSTFGINGFVKINNMGALLNEVAFEYKALWIQTIIYFVTTCLVYNWYIIQSRKNCIKRYKEYKRRKALGLRPLKFPQ